MSIFLCIAYKASDYLEKLISQGSVMPEPNADLDAIYAQYAPPPAHLEGDKGDKGPAAASVQQNSHGISKSIPSTLPESESNPRAGNSDLDSEVRLLLMRDAVPMLGEPLALPEDKRDRFAVDVYRALEQARIRSERENGRGVKGWWQWW